MWVERVAGELKTQGSGGVEARRAQAYSGMLAARSASAPGINSSPKPPTTQPFPVGCHSDKSVNSWLLGPLGRGPFDTSTQYGPYQPARAAATTILPTLAKEKKVSSVTAANRFPAGRHKVCMHCMTCQLQSAPCTRHPFKHAHAHAHAHVAMQRNRFSCAAGILAAGESLRSCS